VEGIPCEEDSNRQATAKNPKNQPKADNAIIVF
jgi:hypothetical protein